MNRGEISPEELADLKALHLTLPFLRTRPWSYIAANPTVLGCLRNTLQASRAAKADRAHLAPENFELT